MIYQLSKSLYFDLFLGNEMKNKGFIFFTVYNNFVIFFLESYFAILREINIAKLIEETNSLSLKLT